MVNAHFIFLRICQEMCTIIAISFIVRYYYVLIFIIVNPNYVDMLHFFICCGLLVCWSRLNDAMWHFLGKLPLTEFRENQFSFSRSIYAYVKGLIITDSRGKHVKNTFPDIFSWDSLHTQLTFFPSSIYDWLPGSQLLEMVVLQGKLHNNRDFTRR